MFFLPWFETKLRRNRHVQDYIAGYLKCSKIMYSFPSST